jgi:glycosyltransferase involved in cell wall biosynthesis
MAKSLPSAPESVAMRFRGDLDLVTALRLHRLFRRRRPHAALCNFGRECWLAGWAALPLGIPVVHVKGVADQRLGGRSRFLYRHLVARVICVSDAVRRGFAALDVPPERFAVVANGIDVVPPGHDDVARARLRLGAVAGDFVVAYSGRLNRDKGVDLLPAAMRELVARGVPVRLVVIGEGELRRDLEVAFVEAGVAERVHFAGFVGDPLPLVAAGDAAVIPSRWTEAFGLVAVEALAVGTPVVAARVGGLAEILADEDTALLVERDDAPGLARALERLWRDPELAAGLRQRGLRRAADFGRARMIAAYEKVLRELAATAEPR